jgi:hypothetical protein
MIVINEGASPRELVRVRADGVLLIDGREVSPAMAEEALCQALSGDELERALACLRKATNVQ